LSLAGTHALRPANPIQNTSLPEPLRRAIPAESHRGRALSAPPPPPLGKPACGAEYRQSSAPGKLRLSPRTPAHIRGRALRLAQRTQAPPVFPISVRKRTGRGDTSYKLPDWRWAIYAPSAAVPG